MKNKEKFAQEIAEIAIEELWFALSKNGEIVKCSGIGCRDCLFNVERGCALKRVEWANAEYKEPKRFTNKEKGFIILFPEIKYLARDKNGALFAYTDKPQKDEGMWDYFGCNNPAASLKHITLWGLEFNDIQWDDEEPTSREEILKGT